MKQAIAALKAGDKNRAFALLRRHLAAHPRDANAWLWMSEAATDSQQKIDALKRVLALAPNHPQAAMIRQRMKKLKDQLAPPVPPAQPPPAASAPWEGLSPDEKMAQIRRQIRDSQSDMGRQEESQTPLVPSLTPMESSGDNRPSPPLDLETLLATDPTRPRPAFPEHRVPIPERESQAAPPPPKKREENATAEDLLAEMRRRQSSSDESPIMSPTPERVPVMIWVIMLLSVVALVLFLMALFNMMV